MDDRWREVPAAPAFVPVGEPRLVPQRPLAWSAPPEAPGPSTPPEARRRDGWALFWHIVFGIDLAFIGLTMVLAVGLYVYAVGTGESVPSTEGDPGGMWLNNIFSLMMFGIIPIVWLLGTRVRPVEGMVRYLRLHDFGRAFLQGAGYAALLLGLVIFLLLAVEIFGVPMEETGSEQRFLGITWPLVLVTAAVAGFGEEVFFRGVLQKWIGVWGQAVVFGLFHIPGGLFAFFITGSIGLLFGYLVKNGRSLWLVIAAHFLYDLFLLSVALLMEQAAAPEAVRWVFTW